MVHGLSKTCTAVFTGLSTGNLLTSAVLANNSCSRLSSLLAQRSVIISWISRVISNTADVLQSWLLLAIFGAGVAAIHLLGFCPERFISAFYFSGTPGISGFASSCSFTCQQKLASVTRLYGRVVFQILGGRGGDGRSVWDNFNSSRSE